MTISENKTLIKDFAKYLRNKNYLDNTILAETETLNYLFNNIAKFDYEHVVKFIEFKKSNGTSTSRLNQFIFTIRAYVRYLNEYKYECDIKLLDIRNFVKKEKIFTGSLEPHEVKKLIWAIPQRYNNEENNNKWGTFFAIMAYTGLSSSEVAKLKGSDVDLENGFIHAITNANFKLRITLIPDKIINVLKQIRQNVDRDEYIFKRKQKGNFSEDTTNISYQFRKRLKLIGLSDKEIQERNLKPHSLRKFYIEECIRNNVPVQELGKLVGHNRYRQTNLYQNDLKVNFDELRNKVNKILD